MPTAIHAATVTSPIGLIHVESTEHGVTGISFTEQEVGIPSEAPRSLLMCLEQLEEYFAGKRKTFDTLPLVMQATDFQEQVWRAAMEIPFGNTLSYGQVAQTIGSPSATRAVGTALSRNSIMIVIPCHRVLPADGSLDSGYAGGSWRKEWLLRHESKV